VVNHVEIDDVVAYEAAQEEGTSSDGSDGTVPPRGFR